MKNRIISFLQALVSINIQVVWMSRTFIGF
jgi:hypothetical protein